MSKVENAPRGVNGRALSLAALLGGLCCASTPAARITFVAPEDPLIVRKPALYPETIEYDRKRDRFLVGSFREGAVYAIDRAGDVTRIIDDARLCSVLGIAIDAERDRLWLVNGDLGASSRPSAAGPRHLIAVGTYDLGSGNPVHYVDLASLSDGERLPNGLALDAAGDAYVTDSFSPNIYRITAEGRASLFLRDARFAGQGINLNGLVVHPDGYLLVIKKSDGSLFKVPLADPGRASRVELDRACVGGDGVTLVGRTDLLIVANQVPETATNAVFSLHSDDGWASAKVSPPFPLGTVYPTTGVVRDGTFYVLASRLNELIQAPAAQKPLLQVQATIRAVAKVPANLIPATH
jgi:sugar lactone lactonase YvrE